jgi:hypothetical protein
MSPSATKMANPMAKRIQNRFVNRNRIASPLASVP